MTIRVGNAPCSWGTLEFEGLESNPVGYKQMLDELVETGYNATELGDWGFMPTEPAALYQEIAGRDLRMMGAYVQTAFKYPEALEAGKQETLKIARLLATAFPKDKPYIILADNNAEEPIRAQNAGRATPAIALSAAEWRTFTGNVQTIARAVSEETGLPVLFHHHCAGYVETPAEMDTFLDLTDPSLVNFVFDTGHFVFGSGPDSPYAGGDIVPALEHYADRVRYIHFKDCEPNIAARSRAEEWHYLTALKYGVFCELGKGSVDFQGVADWLRGRGYDSTVLVEQDVLPGMGSPKDSAQRNRDFIRSIGL